MFFPFFILLCIGTAYAYKLLQPSKLHKTFLHLRVISRPKYMVMRSEDLTVSNISVFRAMKQKILNRCSSLSLTQAYKNSVRFIISIIIALRLLTCSVMPANAGRIHGSSSGPTTGHHRDSRKRNSGSGSRQSSHYYKRPTNNRGSELSSGTRGNEARNHRFKEFNQISRGFDPASVASPAIILNAGGPIITLGSRLETVVGVAIILLILNKVMREVQEWIVDFKQRTELFFFELGTWISSAISFLTFGIISDSGSLKASYFQLQLAYLLSPGI